MADPKHREAILARRKYFIASALAGVALGACSDKKPHVCLEMAPPDPTGSASPQPEPQVCLSEPMPEHTVCLDVPPPQPQVCLSEPMPEPTVCLEVAPPAPSPAPVPKPKQPKPQVCLDMNIAPDKKG